MNVEVSKCGSRLVSTFLSPGILKTKGFATHPSNFFSSKGWILDIFLNISRMAYFMRELKYKPPSKKLAGSP